METRVMTLSGPGKPVTCNRPRCCGGYSLSNLFSAAIGFPYSPTTYRYIFVGTCQKGTDYGLVRPWSELIFNSSSD